MDLNITQIGIGLDIIGAILLFIFGLPSDYINSRVKQMEGTINENQKQINKKIKFGAFCGIVFLIVGFVLQFCGAN